jgi:hypothetical protein
MTGWRGPRHLAAVLSTVFSSYWCPVNEAVLPVFGAQMAPRCVVVVADSAAIGSASALRCTHLDHRIRATNFVYGTLERS